MTSLQLLQLTKRGQDLLTSRRKSLFLVTGVLAAGGMAAYVQSRHYEKSSNPFSVCYWLPNKNKQELEVEDGNDNKLKQSKRKRKNGLKSVRVLAAILISYIGQMGARDLLALVGVVVLRTVLSNRLARVQGFLFRAAFLQRFSTFSLLILENLLLCFLQSTLLSTSKYLTGSLSLRFRKILTRVVHARYFQNMAYYKITRVDGRITNPEQIIASDIPRFCSEFSDLLQDDLAAATDCLLYSWRLCSYASPKYIFWMLGYITAAGGLMKKISPSFGKLTSKGQQLEGEYRQLHSRLRNHAESIAFYGGEVREESHIQGKFRNLVQHIGVVLHDQWWFGMVQDFFFKYLGATVAVILIIEPFFAGHLRPDNSTLGRAEMLSNLRYHTSVVISLFQSLGMLFTSSKRLNQLSGYADRIRELMVISRELSVQDASSLLRKGNKKVVSEANYIEFNEVKVVTPTGNVLVEDLTLKVELGSNLLITGPNGSGKSSLFRVLGGLWPMVSGNIVKPGIGSDLNKEIFYVPQRPYTTVGTLRDQLIYPLSADQEFEKLTHGEMVKLLKNVDLEYLLDRYPSEKEVNWGDELSLGEQQRLGMARLFYHKPKFAILDECTSAVTNDMEERFCAKVRAMGTSCITISHRPAMVAFHEVVLSLDGEGGWNIHDKRGVSPIVSNNGFRSMKLLETDRHNDSVTVELAFSNGEKDSASPIAKSRSYMTELISSSPMVGHDASPMVDHDTQLAVTPQFQTAVKPLPLRIASMVKVLVPTMQRTEGMQLLAIVALVMSRTWVSDRTASLNGTSVKYVLRQDSSSFIRLVAVSIVQSMASSFIAPSLRYLTANIALGWRIHLTQHFLKTYLQRHAYYKVLQMSNKQIDADQRITQDLQKLTLDLSGLVSGMVKPSVDILWFTWRMKLLTGNRGIAILYAYMLLGLGFLRSVAPDFGEFISEEQQLEGTFRFMHERLQAHAESVAFFGGGAREKMVIDSRFKELTNHSISLLKRKWLFNILDDFITKQLPHNVTWGLSFLYAMEHKGDRSLTSTQGELAHALLFLSSIVSQSFLAFGDILGLHRKVLELSGGISRIFELEELFDISQKGTPVSDTATCTKSDESISFLEADIISPGRKLLARKLTCDIQPGKSLLLTGPNGSGKSSVFRVLRGLWPNVNGQLRKPDVQIDGEAKCGVFYIPQRPYTCLGTLRDQVIYPLSCQEAEENVLLFPGKCFTSSSSCVEEESMLDGELRSILEKVKLVYLLEREGGFDVSKNWEDILSLGEQQRLGMARLFFHKPKFGILDECTNATSVDVEEQLYQLACDMGITVMTSSQRPALLQFHSRELRLIDGEGEWELHSIHSTTATTTTT